MIKNFGKDQLKKLNSTIDKVMAKFPIFKRDLEFNRQVIYDEVIDSVLNTYDPERPIGAYAYRVAFNKSLKQKELIQKNMIDLASDLNDPERNFDVMANMHSPSTDPSKVTEEEEKYESVINTINQLKASYRDLLLAFYIGDFSIREIANQTGQKEVTVRVNLHRARKELNKQLGRNKSD